MQHSTQQRRVPGPARVGFIIDGFEGMGGTENQLVSLLSRLDPQRVSTFLCCLHESRIQELDARFDPEVLGITKIISPSGLRGIARARRWIQNHDLDLLVTFFRDANVIGTLAARWAGVRVVSSRRNHGYWHSPFELRLLRFLNRFTYRHLTNSEAVREHTAGTEGVRRDRIEVIENAIDVEVFSVADNETREALRTALGVPGGLVIGCVANLRPVKSVHTLIEAFSKSDALREQGSLVLVGEGPEEVPLRKLVEQLGVANRVHFMGRRSDVSALLPAFDIGVLPSTSESSPNAVLEYMAAGLPTVATDVGGIRELLDQGRLGTIVSPEDAAGMAAALESLADASETRETMGRAARLKVEQRHSWKDIGDQWTRFFENQVMDSRTVPPIPPGSVASRS